MLKKGPVIKMLRGTCAALVCLLTVPALAGSTPPEVVYEATLVPEYRLPGLAGRQNGPRPVFPRREAGVVEHAPGSPLLLHGHAPTERHLDLPLSGELSGDFTIELWLCDHVNRPVGAVARVMAEGAGCGGGEDLFLSYWDNTLVFGAVGTDAAVRHKFEQGWKQYWTHVAAVREGNVLRMMVDGVTVGETQLGARDASGVRGPVRFELAGYMHHEPYMELANLVHEMRLIRGASTEAAMQERVALLRDRVERGALFDGFHFNAGPYLQYPTLDGISILWETDRPASATLRYGVDGSVSETVELPLSSELIREVRLMGLEADTPYFYELSATDETGETVSSGLLTFLTGVPRGKPTRFAVIADTESRPHINARLGRQIWEERPHFVVNAGDLTDGGQEGHKFQWNLEYFVGNTALASRVPVLPVPGNGEGDLYWYNRYHVLPEPESYYEFDHGDVAIFALDSNRRRTEFGPGETQYEWLKERVTRSDATWKIVMHHHPVYSSEQDDYGNTWQGSSTLGDMHVRRIQGLYEDLGIDLVIHGHLHIYERSHPVRDGRVVVQGGVVHLQVGGAGGNFEDFAPTPSWFNAKLAHGYHYVMAEVLGERLTLRMHDIEGRLRDTAVLEK